MTDSGEKKITRREFLKGAGALAAAAGVAVVATGCESNTISLAPAGPTAMPTQIPVPVQYPEVPYTPMAPPPPGTLRVFSPHEARTVEALTARILPGTPDDPGAREAGVVYYIDNFLAYQEGLPEPTYRHPPFAQVYDPANPPPEAVQWLQQQGFSVPQGQGRQGGQSGQSGSPGGQSGQSSQSQGGGQSNPTPTPPSAQLSQPTVVATAAATAAPAGATAAAPSAVTPTVALSGQFAPTSAPGQASQAVPNGQPGQQGYQNVWVPQDDIERYGYQSILTPREVYRLGVAAVDRYANSQFGKDFVDLAENQQDAIVGDMADGKATGFDKQLSAESFFHNLRRHTAEGMFSDPVYGGNRDMIGWKLVGYPGAQRAYDASEFQREGTNRQPQSIMQMQMFNPGQPVNPNVILPVSGSDQQ